MNRRRFLISGAATLAGLHPGRGHAHARAMPSPSPAQLQWQRDERALFLHFGVNTFTDREWGDGTEDPSIFGPFRLDARQWARVARGSGFKAMVLTAKHHDGFCLWPTATTSHSVASSPFRGGAGDVVREFTDACRAEGLRAGLYLSPWDRNSPVYGDSARYNDLYRDQLTELLTRYGSIAEVWFDGANGEGPNGGTQVYDWPRVFAIVRRLQPAAVIFSDAGPDARWCGNETGSAGEPNWSTVDPSVVTAPGTWNETIERQLRHGDPDGSVWRPAEADTSIRPGWFHHVAEDDRVRTVEELVDLHFRSIGRNAKLLLNVPPTRDGILHDTDVARLYACDARMRSLFDEDHAADVSMEWRVTGAHDAECDIDFGRAVRIGIVRLAEDITRGQRVTRFSVAAQSGVLAAGRTIGYQRLERFGPVSVRRIRLAVSTRAETPLPVAIRVFAG